ncbi:TRAP transporter large permease subunit [Halomonas sp. McH1-25]|uniref:TRAP transporter large permease n=1 Tax=unclassified Halomonas TaxID=2609666 RepID=UPI001EF6FF58|nr:MULTISPECIES: TRAP transporter large permease subunit [unclassified Halomonas]MCG7599851.1 TRAP transporter large permease subunit [Halomonas sp. McH1-25]MCP1343059.1 TRAP transporter large permease subunit [Halomonas sp. FL8]MCP1363505.1 TRAP transporter large permease subunit [Halomonas sp. BBD45]MCP1364381.1 TRAP transporter large permease subunit [Halomonas sp. BBD48]
MNDTVIVLLSLVALIGLGMPIFLALGFSGLVGLYLAKGSLAFFFAPSSLFGQLNSFELIALPLFVLMGNFLGATPVGASLFQAAVRWLNWLRGSLAISSVGASAMFGAVSGVSLAGVAAVGSIAVPQMLERGYSRSLAAGSVVSAGALAMLIPPSVPFIIYGAVSSVSVADLFIGGIVPGIVLALALSLYIYLRVRVRPGEAPRATETFGWGERFRSLANIWHAALLVVAVLGSIYSGLATPSEAAGIGALGAFLIATAVFRSLSWRRLLEILGSTVRISGAILLIIGCAKIFGDYLNLVRVPQILTEMLTASALPPWAILLAVMVLLVLLGMIVDAVSLIVVTTPVLLPLIQALGYDPLWFGIVLVLNLEIAVVTPPVGLNLYALRGVCPELSIEEIIRSALPFVAVQFLVLMLFVLFPGLSLWLPGLM